MDIITMIILEDKLDIPLDVLKFMNEYIKYEELNDDNFLDAIRLWFEDEKLCRIKYGHISLWETGKITDMDHAFWCGDNFNEDISNWNVSNVKTMEYMFRSATSFNSDLSNWNVSNVKSMKCMFSNTINFNSDL